MAKIRYGPRKGLGLTKEELRFLRRILNAAERDEQVSDEAYKKTKELLTRTAKKMQQEEKREKAHIAAVKNSKIKTAQFKGTLPPKVVKPKTFKRKKPKGVDPKDKVAYRMAREAQFKREFIERVTDWYGPDWDPRWTAEFIAAVNTLDADTRYQALKTTGLVQCYYDSEWYGDGDPADDPYDVYYTFVAAAGGAPRPKEDPEPEIPTEAKTPERPE